MVKASMCQKMDALPDDMLIVHDQRVDAGQYQEISHPGQLGAFDRDTPIIFTGDHYGQERVGAAFPCDDANFEIGWAKGVWDAVWFCANLPAHGSQNPVIK